MCIRDRYQRRVHGIVVKGTLIMNQSTDYLNREHYKNNFKKIDSSDSLTRLERNIYFVFANSLNSIHKTLSETGPLISNICESVREKQNKNLIIIHVVTYIPVSYTHLRAHETSLHLVCRLLLEKKKIKNQRTLHT
eukprot:TRINITY_DN24603_c0_g1_i1.p1 TRINITY_DN24603_c0_g1~~TRINITY_DN24603_c0_g1_i1.p1  ORF type:complete len:136 (+),score=27.48 TRINITY_DN24603_c0_g1_i1:160-567(+)